MATAFDPYHRWLSIPPAEQPPNHYRLLGLQAFEGCVEVIANAAVRQLKHVRPHLNSPLRPYAANLVRELEAARHCLLQAEEKSAYDSWLKNRLEIGQNSRPTQSLAFRPTENLVADSFELQGNRPSLQSTHFDDSPSKGSVAISPMYTHYAGRTKRRNTSNPLAFLTLWLAGGAMGLLAGYAVLCMLDPKYDFLHVMFPVTENDQQRNFLGDSRDPGPKPQIRRPPPQLRPRDRNASGTNIGEDDSSLNGGSATRPFGRGENANPTPPRRRYRFVLPSVLPLQVPVSQYSPHPHLFASLSDGVDFASKDYQFKMSLTQGAKHELGEVKLARDASNKTEQDWVLTWVPFVSRSPKAGSIEVGRFSTLGNQLLFAWAMDPPSPAITAVRNSLLHLQFDNQRHAAALRASEPLPSFSIGLERELWIARCDIDDLPNIDEVRIDISQSVTFPSATADGGSTSGMRIGDVCTLRYDGAPGAATYLNVVEQNSFPAIEFRSRYHLPSGEEGPLTAKDGSRALSRLERELSSRLRSGHDPNRIPILQTDIAALKRIGIETAKWYERWGLSIRYYLVVNGHEIDIASTSISSIN